MSGGRPAARRGTEATLQAPLAITSVRQRHCPRLVMTSYPPSACRTLVTRVAVTHRRAGSPGVAVDIGGDVGHRHVAVLDPRRHS